jgi:hypothetical protein
MEDEGQDLGHGEEDSHTVESAAAALEGLLSGDSEDQQDDDAEPQDDALEGQEGAEDTDEEETPSESEDELEDEDEEQDEQPQEPQKHKVKVDGREEEVTLEELLKGYSRTSDYTRKTQATAARDKELEAEREAVRAERQRYATSLVDLESALKSMSSEPDWDKLRKENPAVFPEVFAEWQLHTQKLKAVEEERQAAVAAVQADHDKAHKAFLAAENAKLLEAIPEWKDQAVSKKDRDDLLAYGQQTGFSEQELKSVVDSRALIMLRKAMLYDRAEAAKAAAQPKVKEKIDKAKVVAPGPKGKSQVTELTRRNQRLAKTGSVKDAASSIELLFG